MSKTDKVSDQIVEIIQKLEGVLKEHSPEIIEKMWLSVTMEAIQMLLIAIGFTIFFVAAFFFAKAYRKAAVELNRSRDVVEAACAWMMIFRYAMFLPTFFLVLLIDFWMMLFDPKLYVIKRAMSSAGLL